MALCLGLPSGFILHRFTKIGVVNANLIVSLLLSSLIVPHCYEVNYVSMNQWNPTRWSFCSLFNLIQSSNRLICVRYCVRYWGAVIWWTSSTCPSRSASPSLLKELTTLGFFSIQPLMKIDQWWAWAEDQRCRDQCVFSLLLSLTEYYEGCPYPFPESSW